MTVTQVDGLLDRIRAVPRDRVIVLPHEYSRDDAGVAATRILRASAEKSDDLLLLIPPTGIMSAALSLSEVLRLPQTAPSLGVLFGPARTASLALLQGCTVRIVSEHAELQPGAFDLSYSATCLILGGTEPQMDKYLRELERERLGLIDQHAAVTELVARRSGRAVSEITADLADQPHYAGSEAVEAGWADAVLKPPTWPSTGPGAIAWTERLLKAVTAGRTIRLPGRLGSAAAVEIVTRLLDHASEPEEPVVLIMGKTRDLHGSLWLSSYLPTLPMQIVGVAASTLDAPAAILLQACTVRLADREVMVTLGLSPNWTNSSIVLTPAMSVAETRDRFLHALGRGTQRIERLADALARRSTEPAEAWLRRLKQADDLGPTRAIELGLIDGFLDP